MSTSLDHHHRGNSGRALVSIREVHDALDREDFTVTELTQAYLEAARASDLNAYLLLCEERALAQAKAADTILASEGKVPRQRLPLFGIPMGIKDNLVIQGVRTTCASKMLENYIPPYTATCVERLESAGAITLGKLNLDEFAMGGSNENSAFGPVKHPTHPDRVPGGSSGGSAAAVRARLCHAALGSDTGGSIRLPASYCGIVGLKPTYGSVSRYGLVAFASSLDQVGPMTASVEDSALISQVISGHDPKDSTSVTRSALALTEKGASEPEWSKLRVGVPSEFFAAELFSEGLQPEVKQRIEASLAFFRSRGAKVSPVELPHTKYSVATYYLVAMSEASSNLSRFDGVRYGTRPKEADLSGDLSDFYKKVRANFGPEVKRRILLGTFALSSGYSDAYYRRACQVRRLVKQDFDRAFESVDLIAGPVAPGTAFRLGQKTADPLRMYLNDIFTIPANLAGLPALSVPCGQDAEGLPVGLQLQGPQFSEALLLSVGRAFEKGRAH